MNVKAEQISNSAVWSAYGDAIGFITELADQKILKLRTRKTKINGLSDWTRRLGGISGAMVELPRGTYSDDTQLRLAASRSINSSGYFDVESFANIELTVFLSYALGAGRGTKLAASNLIKSGTNWFSNFYENKNASYCLSGGNGAAMRIQPHVWAGANLPGDAMLLDVFRNTICTHGHPRAILGAVFHALLLQETLQNKKIPDVSRWKAHLDTIVKIPKIISDDMQIATFWLPMWENKTGESFLSACELVCDEIQDGINTLEDIDTEVGSRSDKYVESINRLDGFNPSVRGSGTITVLLASYLAHLYQEAPMEAMVIAANQLQSDTDTIATIAGALLGAVTDSVPPERVLDQKYIEAEALRIFDISREQPASEFSYPDLFDWKAPRKLADALFESNTKLYVTGLGGGRAIQEGDIVGKNKTLRWKWVKTDYGQTLFIRSREQISLGDNKLAIGEYLKKKNTIIPAQNALPFDIEDKINRSSETTSNVKISKQLDDYIAEARSLNFLPSVIGDHITELSKSLRPLEDIIAYTSIISNEIKKQVRART